MFLSFVHPVRASSSVGLVCSVRRRLSVCYARVCYGCSFTPKLLQNWVHVTVNNENNKIIEHKTAPAHYFNQLNIN